MQILADIRKELPQAVLLVAGGKHKFAGTMEELAAKTEGIVFTGWLEGDELKAAYNSADLVLVPSLYFDCIPIIMIEAMACRKPVVASRLANASEVVGNEETGCIINPFDIDNAAEKIISLLKNPEKAKHFGQAGYERVQKFFSLDAQVAQTLSYYQKFSLDR